MHGETLKYIIFVLITLRDTLFYTLLHEKIIPAHNCDFYKANILQVLRFSYWCSDVAVYRIPNNYGWQLLQFL